MSFENPTPVTVGMSGTFVGRRYRVAGRVVLGMDEEGETYYWNEYNLVGADGNSATLVYEESEQEGEWRLFTFFEPRNPMSVGEAATKRVGDPVTFDDRLMRVTLVDESRVYHIEGEAPEGVEVGDLARYFNAGVGNGMVVVSWTGDEIEFYRGLDLPSAAVAAAFGLPSERFLRALRPRADTAASKGWVGKLVGALLVVMMMFVVYSSCRARRHQAAPAKPKTPPAPLALGAAGQLNGANYRIRSHTVVEMAQVGLLYDRHEYELFDEGEGRELLVFDSKSERESWFLFTPIQPARPLTARQAAARRTGEQVDLDGISARVTELFRATIRQAQSLEQSTLTNGAVLYGFAARSGTNQFLARWNEDGITFYRGRRLPAKVVTDAFPRKTGR
jgi:hypothetical protein